MDLEIIRPRVLFMFERTEEDTERRHTDKTSHWQG